MKYIVAFGLALLMSASVQAVEKNRSIKNSEIEFYRIHSSNHSFSNVRKYVVVQVPNFEGDCLNGFYFSAEDDREMYSTLLAVVMAKIDFSVAFDTENKAPWGDPSFCALTSIDI